MILDARKATTCRTGRPYTCRAAVSNLLDEMEVGMAVDVDALIAPDGSLLNRYILAANVTKLKGERVFQVATMRSNAKLATVRRLA